MKKNVAYLPGDGIGPEVAEQAKQVLQKIAEKYNHEFIFQEAQIGAIAIEKTGSAFPEETKTICENSDAILFGAVGDPKFDNDPTSKVRPEQGILGLRKALGLYANIRPIYSYDSLLNQSPIKNEIVKGSDFVVIRELIGGLYFGKKGREDNNKTAFDTMIYTTEEIERVSRYAFELAKKRKGHLTVVDKANVLESSRLWRETVQKLEKDYPDIKVDYMFVDNAAMSIIKNPTSFDVIVTENMFGDVLTDEASVITGSLGMLPSASVGEKTSLYEPIHGSYPQAKDKNIANPIGSIMSAAMMLDLSFNMKEESKAIYKAIEETINAGIGTEDINKDNPTSTTDLTQEIINKI